jgi:deoxyribose-phosphate aldolase
MENLNQFIEYTNLRPNIKEKDIDKLIREASEYKFRGICIPPFWLKKARRELGNSHILLVTVVGFPLGYNMTETKISEMKCAVDDGVDEMEVVMNLSAFKSGMPWVKTELAKCASFAHDNETILKIIIETALLNADEIAAVCRICADAGADFVKTSTGFATAGAKVEDVSLMRKVLPPRVGIKATGGIRSHEDVIEIIQAGADIVGTSSAPQIIESMKQSG